MITSEVDIMDKASRSVFVFGIYLALLGLGLVLVPNALLTLFGFKPTTEAWIRIVGMLIIIIAYYDIEATRTKTASFYRWTVVARIFSFLLLTTFVVLGLAQPVLILFGLIDLAGATWTALALRGGAGK